MAPIGGPTGGGQAGFGSGGSFTGPAEALELVYPNRCYAYSGVINCTGETTMFDFTTGNYVAVLNLQYVSGEDSGTDQAAKVYLNNTVIYHALHNETRDQFNDAKFPQIIVVPAYTEFKFTIEPAAGADIWSATLSGRTYSTTI